MGRGCREAAPEAILAHLPASDHYGLALQAHILEPETQALHLSQPGSVEKPQVESRDSPRGRDEPVHLLAGERFRKMPRASPAPQRARRARRPSPSPPGTATRSAPGSASRRSHSARAFCLHRILLQHPPPTSLPRLPDTAPVRSTQTQPQINHTGPKISGISLLPRKHAGFSISPGPGRFIN